MICTDVEKLKARMRLRRWSWGGIRLSLVVGELDIILIKLLSILKTNCIFVVYKVYMLNK